ncbi:hypothetical protein ACFPJ1_27480 [Kribbella qitaiheensis]
MTSKPHKLRTGTLVGLLVASIVLLIGATLWERNIDAAAHRPRSTWRT